jgi:glycosyltransferase involved in cell wall biosynthesis
MNILFLSTWFPYPPINGAKIRVYNLIRELAKNHEVTLLSFAQTIPIEEALQQIPFLGQYCHSVNVFPAKPYTPDNLESLKGFFSLLPRSVVQAYSPEMANLVEKKINTNTFDAVVASEVNAPTVTSLLASRIRGVPIILDALEIGLAKQGYYGERSLLRRIRRGMTWFKLRNFTKRLLSKSTACTVPSLQERRNLLEITSDQTQIEIIPHSVDLNHYKGFFGFPREKSLVFTGSFTYKANLDAAFYLIEKIYPQIKAKLPEVKVNIVGSTNGVDITSWPVDNNINFTGLLKDVRPTVTQSWVSIVPLRIGAGTRLKIIESMALGTPVVSTSKGAEGLDVIHGENILIADDPYEFAQAVLEVLQNHQLHEKLSSGGHKLVQEKYSSEIMGRKFNFLLERINS